MAGRAGTVIYHAFRGAVVGDRRMTGQPPTIVDATDRPPAEWDRLAVRSAAGHAFQSHAWGELKRPLGWSVGRFLVADGAGPVAVVSLQVRGLFGGLFAGRSGGRSGGLGYAYAPRGPVLLRTDPEAARAALAGLRSVAAAVGAAVLTIDPAWPARGPSAAALAHEGFRPGARDIQVSRTAMIVPALPDEAAQHRLVRKSTANLINRARRDGASAERIDLAAAPPAERDVALARMHEILTATAKREGIVLRDRDYQLAQWRALGEAGVASLWFGTVGGRRWTGSLLLHCGATLLQYQAGSADEADLRRVPANHLLQWEILRWAATVGFGGYDLGGVDVPGARGLPRDESHPLWDLYIFKRGFGAEGIEYVPAHERAANRLIGAAWRLARRLR